ncbi:HAMP domain-containing sensor histidine kinase [Novosphingobium sp. G106]|uniref:sensor histidine kinase n=1 Tax=Novosphingobium sp. G106 TaxID=2849500 RepID=UPI0020C476DA|nr:ATP-binding protein [Novosphingobium sp. G106]
MMPAAIRSAAFRFAFLLALIFAAGAAALLVVVQRQIKDYAADATKGSIRAESAVLAGEYRSLGRSGLIEAMGRHQSASSDAQFRYLLLDGQGHQLFGDLPLSAVHNGWSTFQVRETEPRQVLTQEMFSSLTMSLPDGLKMVVATDNFDVENMRQRLRNFTLVSGIAITLFALIGGYIIGGLFLRRLTRVNQSVDRIVEGELTERLPMIGFGPEFDELARNLNRMIDRNALAMEALRQVSTNIAHDLRTPLTRLHQRLEVMQQSGVAEPSVIDDALAETTSLLETFQALLRIGAVEGGIGRRYFRCVDLTELMDRVQQAYEPVAEDADHFLLADHARGITVDGDAELLAQLFTNLIENAIVHTPPGTVITSRLIMIDGAPAAEICDTGAGIPPIERSKVFGRFYRLDASRHTEGAGLGLALVAAIASLHNASHAILETDGLCVRIMFPRRTVA